MSKKVITITKKVNTPIMNNKITIHGNLSEHPNFIEVCAGAGGLSTGLMKAGFIPVLLNDNNVDCCDTLRTNHPNVEIFKGSMTDIHTTKYRDQIDLLTGGIPCQSWSLAGKKKGLADPRGDLMLQFIKMIEDIRPKVFLIENVKGLLIHEGGKTLKYIISLIEDLKLYNIQYQVLNAYNYSVPQKRERIFIIGILKTISKPYAFPKENSTKIVLKDILNQVPPSPCTKYSTEKEKLFKLIPPGGCWINLPINLQQSYLGNSYNSGGGKRGILHRLSMQEPSLTLLCTPSQKQTERCHPTENRPLSIRESARIQTFNDNYHFSGSMASQYKQIGNAVPVELARQMGISIRTLFS